MPEPTKNSNNNAAPEAASKMHDAAPLRDREFPEAPRSTQGASHNPNVIANTGRMEPETIAEGGNVGEVDGDTQSVGEMSEITDQDEATPDFAQQR